MLPAPLPSSKEVSPTGAGCTAFDAGENNDDNDDLFRVSSGEGLEGCFFSFATARIAGELLFFL